MSTSDTPTISTEQVARLAERMDTVIINHSKLEGLIQGIALQQQQTGNNVAVFQERLSTFDMNQQRLFQLCDAHRRDIDVVGSDVKSHSLIWKLVGGTASVAVAAVAWNLQTMRDLERRASALENRQSVAEFQLNTNSRRTGKDETQ